MVENTMNNNEGFEYTYSASMQKEIKEIRKKYLPNEEDKMETLRKLDKNAERPGMMTAISVGVVGSLILGIGMCCTLIWNTSTAVFVLGVVLGLFGLVIASCAYPLYEKITKREREKIADQILALSKELSM